MTRYLAPVQDLLFGLQHLVGLDVLTKLPGWQDVDMDTTRAILQACAQFNQEVVAPLNLIGDQVPACMEDGQVRTTPGFASAYRQFAQDGWQGLAHPELWGGQGLPRSIASACTEMLHSANMSFGLCPLLTDGAIEALLTAGSQAQHARYLPALVSGQCSGTMNLTEPQAGSDLSQVRTQAQRQPDGSYYLRGTKIFITYGEHDLTPNIVHLVLARVVGAPAGVKGLSLFVVPKFLVQADGSLGPRNGVQALSLEHKLGIKASPTAVMEFGGTVPAQGELLGQENQGLSYMFVMMNAARFAVGLQGVALAQRAYQQAVDYAKMRVQSRLLDGTEGPIIHHPDVRRMLMTMRALTEGARALALWSVSQRDLVDRHPDAAVRAHHQALYEFMVPVVKGYATEISQEVTSLAVQVHGGMGFIEETGVAQYYRDAKILTIYEGTTAIQANDLLGRKTWARDGGQMVQYLLAQIAQTQVQLGALRTPAGQAVCQQLHTSRLALERVVAFLLNQACVQPSLAYAGAVPYLMLVGHVLSGWLMARAMWVAFAQRVDGAPDVAFLEAKEATAHFHALHILSRVPGLEVAIVQGAQSVGGLRTDQF